MTAIIPAQADRVSTLPEIALFCGMSVHRLRTVHLNAMAECGAIFRKPRKIRSYVYWGFKDRLIRYMTEYQRLNGHL